MAKTYVDIVKYIIHTEFEIKGVVDRHDIIGAIFGQCEGLLGEEMDLKELQDAGKLGRIEVNFESKLGITKGEALIPSSMDTASTSLLAAAIETVDKVGPCEAKFKSTRIEDSREDKRKQLAERAKQLLKQLSEQLPEAKELTTELKQEARIAEVQEYSEEKLPAGPDIEKEQEIIVVEGRADVINLLRNHINNAIGMGGAKIAKAIIELSRRKDITLFIDGDRGGELNARKLMQVADIKFIAKAPAGKEVEELARKEILGALRNKVQAQAAFPETTGSSRESRERPREHYRSSYPSRREFSGRRNFRTERGRFAHVPRSSFAAAESPMNMPNAEEHAKFEPLLQSIKGTMQGKLYDENMQELAAANVRELIENMAKFASIHAIVFDGIVTKRLVDEALKRGCKYIVGIRKGKLENTPGIKVFAF